MVMVRQCGLIVLQCIITMIRALCHVGDNCGQYCYAQDICNFRFGNASDHNDTLDSFVSYLDIPCPPPDQLHQVCNSSWSPELPSCDERVSIIDRCLHRFPGLYNDSLWGTCLMDAHKCDDIVNYLIKEGFIENNAIETTVSDSVTSSIVVTSEPVIHSSDITSHELDITTSKHLISSEPSSSKVVTDSTEKQKDITTMEDSVIAPSDDSSMFPQPLSVAYPLIGSIVILCEIAILCTWFCYKKRKQKTAAHGSLVQQEEVIEPVSASPTKALRNNYDEDKVKTEDEHIYRSYINLKYIDESAESTPEKVTLRT